MPGRTAIEAEAILFSELFHQGRFAVPWHQRAYDWNVMDVQALLHDIADAIKDNRQCYFLGAIMLVKTSANTWEINDGQQRMVTISLICSALCRRFAREAPGSQHEGHSLRMLFVRDAYSTSTLENADRYRPRIDPPKNDAVRYRRIICGSTIGTNGKLTAAWSEIEKYFSGMDLSQLKRYLDYILQRLEVACLRVPQSIDPNAVYETLNSRGKRLEDFDLLRNLLYSQFNADSESERRQVVHDNLDRIRIMFPSTSKNRTVSSKAPEYMRCHLQCRYGFLRKDNFYRESRAAILAQSDKSSRQKGKVADYVFDLAKEISSPESLELYKVITASTPDPDFVDVFEVASGATRSRRNLRALLRELRNYKVTQPLVFSLLSCYIRERDGRSRKQVARIIYRNLKHLAAFVCRTAFVAPKFEPSLFESAFSNYAKDIWQTDDIAPDAGFLDFLRDCDRSAHGVMNNATFEQLLVNARMTGNPKIRLFLLGINDAQQPDARLVNDRLCTVEHILPRADEHWVTWGGFDDVDNANWIDRIGNLTLMGPTDNRPGKKDNATFEKKRDSYAASGLAITRSLGNYSEWTPETIELRQSDMIHQAIRVWGFDR